MMERRNFSGVFTVTMAGGGTGHGRNTFEMSGEGPIPDMLTMADIRKAEASLLKTVREENYGAQSLMLTWWTEIREDHP